MSGAGKSYCIDYLKAKNILLVYFGGIVVDETIRRYGKTDEEHEKIVREGMRTIDGKDAIAKKILTQIDQLISQGETKLLADGLYSWTEYKLFKEHWSDNAIIIAVVAPRNLRHQRLENRPIRPLTEEEVTAREYAEIENIEKGGPIANVDYTILNKDTPVKMLAQLDKTLEELQIIL